MDLYDDGAMRLAGERHHDPLGVLVDDIAYEYDAAGNRIARSSAAGQLDYAYDAGYRLISAAGTAGSEAYTTDPGGRVTGIARAGGASASPTTPPTGRRPSPTSVPVRPPPTSTPGSIRCSGSGPAGQSTT